MNLDRTWRTANRRTPRLPLMFRLRLRFGMFWKSVRPSVDDFDSLANWLLALVMIAMLMTAYGYVDANDQKATALEESRQATKSLAHLLSGGVLTNPEATVAVKCVQVMDVVL
jgi:hypothetical protein